MYDLLTAQEIRKRIRTHFMKDVSLRAIHALAQKLGYKIKSIGGKRGYHKSVYTALQRHFSELLAYDTNNTKKTPQKAPKQQIQGDYYAYNGERDNKDYDWEVDESVVKMVVAETIERFINEAKEQRALQTNIFGGVDDLTEKNKKEVRKRKLAQLRKERSKERKEKAEIERKRQEFENDSNRMVNGGLFGPNT